MLLNRIIGVFKLDSRTFEEIENDRSATGQAALVVLIVALLGAIGSGILTASTGGGSFFASFLGGLIAPFIGWLVWSAITYFVGTSFFGGRADMGEMLRVIGFAYAPQVLGIIPCLGTIVGLIWTLAALFIGIRQGLDLDNTKTALTIVIGLVAYIVIIFIVSFIFGGAMAATGALSGS
jgi:hypothetical protein